MKIPQMENEMQTKNYFFLHVKCLSFQKNRNQIELNISACFKTVKGKVIGKPFYLKLKKIEGTLFFK
jgi:hypothetical protein